MFKLYRRPGTPHWWVSFSAGGHRVRRSLRVDDRQTADELAARLYRDALTGEAADRRPALTLDHALSRYVAEHARYLPSAVTVMHQGKALVRIIGRATPLGSIDDAAVSAFVARRRGERAVRGHGRKVSRRMERRISNSTVNRETGLLRAVMERARKLWKIDVADVTWKLHRLPEADHRTRYLSVEEADRLLAVAPAHLRPPILCALFTGLRLANVMALDWADVDLTARRLTVRVKSRKPGGKLLTVPIAGPLVAELALLGGKDRGPVFTYRGRPVAKMRRSFATAIQRAGITDFHWHDLRHTAASWMVQRGVPLAVVRDILGHSDIKLTARYAHVAPAQKREAVEAIGDHWRPGGSATEKQRIVR
jgi:integrase